MTHLQVSGEYRCILYHKNKSSGCNALVAVDVKTMG